MHRVLLKIRETSYFQSSRQNRAERLACYEILTTRFYSFVSGSGLCTLLWQISVRMQTAWRGLRIVMMNFLKQWHQEKCPGLSVEGSNLGAKKSTEPRYIQEISFTGDAQEEGRIRTGNTSTDQPRLRSNSWNVHAALAPPLPGPLSAFISDC